jgi:hypothetical protein
LNPNQSFGVKFEMDSHMPYHVVKDGRSEGVCGGGGGRGRGELAARISRIRY